MYDLIIIGAGPAGLTAGIYSARHHLKTIILGKILGGTVSEVHKIGNFPTYHEISGKELTEKMVDQVKKLGIKIKNEEVIQISKSKEGFTLKTEKGKYNAKKLILALGKEKRKTNIKGEKEFAGKGVSYCAVCDAQFFKNKEVAVIGGGDSALATALLTSEFAKKVFIIHRGENLKGEPGHVHSVKKNNKIEVIFNSNITEIRGNKKVEKIKLDTGKEIKIDGVFIEAGTIPQNRLTSELGINLEEEHIIVNKKQETNIKGVFAAGDITNNLVKQMITAAAEGAVAAISAYEEISRES
ncbi:hypothetical protein COV15_02150 [Candidatus Woesearchaeota archaeon CG10_big_fil_rev_8_21_14_0_10_34_12]|nr:MAG: hypothetical protein COV15_02150 [Candidatus Woesearchaeota archaeon CG10_big_fil_rev_8_21_14_0_10_34_12]